MPDGAALAVLDPRGKDHSSEDLAALISTWRDGGFAAACFAIGGADGHADMKNIGQTAADNQVAKARHGMVSGFGMVNYDRGLCSAAAILSGGAA